MNQDPITQEMVAKWYNLTIHGLRYRFKKHGVRLQHRLLTISDVQYIISKCGIPPNMPDGILPPWFLPLSLTIIWLSIAVHLMLFTVCVETKKPMYLRAY